MVGKVVVFVWTKVYPRCHRRINLINGDACLSAAVPQRMAFQDVEAAQRILVYQVQLYLYVVALVLLVEKKRKTALADYKRLFLGGLSFAH